MDGFFFFFFYNWNERSGGTKDGHINQRGQYMFLTGGGEGSLGRGGVFCHVYIKMLK